MDFMILEDLRNIIDSSLSEVVLGKPFAQASYLTYDESLGIIRFAHSDDEVVFRIPQRKKELDLVSPLEKDKFEAFFVEILKGFPSFYQKPSPFSSQLSGAASGHLPPTTSRLFATFHPTDPSSPRLHQHHRDHLTSIATAISTATTGWLNSTPSPLSSTISITITTTDATYQRHNNITTSLPTPLPHHLHYHQLSPQSPPHPPHLHATHHHHLVTLPSRSHHKGCVWLLGKHQPGAFGSGLTTRGVFGCCVNSNRQLGKGSTIPTDPQHTPTIIQPSSSQPQKTQKPRKPTIKDTQVPHPSGLTQSVADEAVHKELRNKLVRAATIASSLEAKQDSGNITKTQSKATPNESSSQGTDSGGGPRCQETMRDTIAQTRRVEKLEKKNRSRTHRLKRLYKVGLSTRVESSGDEESLDVLGGEEMFVAGQNKNVVEEVVDAAQVSTATTTVTITTEKITLAQALKALKTSKPKVKGIVSIA
nr:protein kinase-like domain, concanavalin A-like lectin/glucanase domain protein [Tanacetum cinerariifolium]